MDLKDEFAPIRDWAYKRGLYEKGDPKTQSIKLQEESGELARAIIINDLDEVKDAIGDIVVVLTNLANMYNLTIEDCINSAFAQISDRVGTMKNGSFVKNEK